MSEYLIKKLFKLGSRAVITKEEIENIVGKAIAYVEPGMDMGAAGKVDHIEFDVVRQYHKKRYNVATYLAPFDPNDEMQPVEEVNIIFMLNQMQVRADVVPKGLAQKEIENVAGDNKKWKVKSQEEVGTNLYVYLEPNGPQMINYKFLKWDEGSEMVVDMFSTGIYVNSLDEMPMVGKNDTNPRGTLMQYLNGGYVSQIIGRLPDEDPGETLENGYIYIYWN